MILTRLKTAIILLTIGLTATFLGGWFYFAFIAFLLLQASREFSAIYKKGGFNPNSIILIFSVFVLVLFRYFFEFKYSDLLLALIFLVSMAAFTIKYETSQQQSPIDLAITLFGVLYFGWVGSYFISVMSLDGGKWWLLLCMLIIAIADSGAYFVGRKIGKNKMSPKTSPKKTWEGYFGGVLVGIVGGLLIGLLFHQFNPNINIFNSLSLGAVLSIITPLGDLGESMIKRHLNVKDTGNLLPGHGGVMDRIDTWVWAVCIGYYFITLFFLK